VLSVDSGAGTVVAHDQAGRFVIVDKIGVAGQIAEETYRDLAE
jgi:hypothetical protein